MTVYIARWRNGDCAFVWANNKAEAMHVLDEQADPWNVELKRLKSSAGLFFSLNDKGSIDFQTASESALEALDDVYPIVAAHRDEMAQIDDQVGFETPPPEVIARERRRALRHKRMPTEDQAVRDAFYGVPEPEPSPEDRARREQKQLALDSVLRAHKAFPKVSAQQADAALAELEAAGVSITKLMEDEEPVDFWVPYQAAVRDLVAHCRYQPVEEPAAKESEPPDLCPGCRNPKPYNLIVESGNYNGWHCDECFDSIREHRHLLDVREVQDPPHIRRFVVAPDPSE